MVKYALQTPDGPCVSRVPLYISTFMSWLSISLVVVRLEKLYVFTLCACVALRQINNCRVFDDYLDVVIPLKQCLCCTVLLGGCYWMGALWHLLEGLRFFFLFFYMQLLILLIHSDSGVNIRYTALQSGKLTGFSFVSFAGERSLQY